jgi:hypothetical protein
VANESSGGGQADPAFAQLLGLAGIPEWGDSTGWQDWVIDTVKRHEQEQGYDRHPMGMTMQYPVPEQTKVNQPLYDSRAEWISPGYDDEVFAAGGVPQAPGAPPSRWLVDPPAADGGKVIINDTDHYALGGDALWAWKSFLRGLHPILMDFGLLGGVDPPDPSAGGPMSYAAFEPARWAMGDTLRLASRMNLLEMQPRADLRVCAGQPRPGVPGPAAQPGGWSVHGAAGAGHLRGGVVQHPGPPDDPCRSHHRRALRSHRLQRPIGALRPHRPVPEAGLGHLTADNPQGR